MKQIKTKLLIVAAATVISSVSVAASNDATSSNEVGKVADCPTYITTDAQGNLPQEKSTGGVVFTSSTPTAMPNQTFHMTNTYLSSQINNSHLYGNVMCEYTNQQSAANSDGFHLSASGSFYHAKDNSNFTDYQNVGGSLCGHQSDSGPVPTCHFFAR